MLLSALVVWLYLRIIRRRKPPARRDLVALAMACWALVSAHAICLAVYIILPLFHLLAVRKDRRWLQVTLAALAGLLLATPQLAVVLSAGVAYVSVDHGARDTGLGGVFENWIMVMSNGSPLLLALAVAVAFIGWRRRRFDGAALALFALLIFALGLYTALSDIITPGHMRYTLVGAPLVWLVFGAGLFALYTFRRWLALLALLWLVASGIQFMNSANWDDYIQWRTFSYTHPPWHTISRWMQARDDPLPAIGIDVSLKLLDRRGLRHHHLRTYWFDRHGITIGAASPDNLSYILAANRQRAPGWRIIYQTASTSNEELVMVKAALDAQGYMRCNATRFANDTVLATWRLKELDCQASA